MAHILIVEDDPIGAEVATIICEAAGHTTVLALGGRQALERLAEAPFDLILLDVQMPELDGLTLTRLLRANPVHADLPILGCTATAGSEALAAMRAAGMTDVVTKPYRNATLRDAVANTLKPIATAPEALMASSGH
jgi:CheY-like chemotaxis protein